VIERGYGSRASVCVACFPHRRIDEKLGSCLLRLAGQV